MGANWVFFTLPIGVISPLVITGDQGPPFTPTIQFNPLLLPCSLQDTAIAGFTTWTKGLYGCCSLSHGYFRLRYDKKGFGTSEIRTVDLGAN